MNIHLIGAIGGANFGDEFILNTCKEQYSSLGCSQFSFSGFDKNIILADKAIDHVENTTSKEINFFDIMMQLRSDFANKGPLADNEIINLLNNHPKINLIHFIGGGYINSLWPSNYALLAIARLYSLIYQTPIFATGLGLFPYVEDPQLCTLFNSLNLIDVRDQQSHQFISSSSITGDDALLTMNRIKKHETDPALIISLQNHLFSDNNILDYLFSPNYLNQLVKNNIHKIIIIEAAPEDIVPFEPTYLKNTSNLSINVDFMTGEDLIYQGIPYHPNSKVIASRFHIHLIYAMMGLGGIALYDNEYYQNKHNSVLEMGSCWPLTDKVNAIENIKTINLFSNQYQGNIQQFSNLFRQKEKLFQSILTNNQNTKAIEKDILLQIINTYIGE